MPPLPGLSALAPFCHEVCKEFALQPICAEEGAANYFGKRAGVPVHHRRSSVLALTEAS